MTDDEIKAEWLRCDVRPSYFLDNYVQVYDATTRAWIPFKLWPAQFEVLDTLLNNRLVIILKARQLGLSWLVLGYILWVMLFRPAATALIFSRRDDEAINLVDDRLKGMYQRLPPWMQARSVTENNAHEFQLSNGSVARAFPTTGGDSYTATVALVDEADLVPDLGKLMTRVKPTIDAGGQLILLSRADKAKPESEFKRIYRAAKQKLNEWAAVFLPWFKRPDRTAKWYAAQRRDVQTRTGALDELYEQYPATDVQALAPATLSKRIAAEWLQRCYAELPPLSDEALKAAGAPAIPGLAVYRLPEPRHLYVIGADPAEGNPTSDDSAATVLDKATGEEVARLRGKLQPSTLASHVDALGRWFNGAAVLVERNNHGHAVLLWLKEHSRLKKLAGWDGRAGWLSSQKGKTLLYDEAADAFRDDVTELHSFDTFTQLSSIDGSTLAAPEGELDDLADSYALALAATSRKPATRKSGQVDWDKPPKSGPDTARPARTDEEIERLLEAEG